MKRKIALLLAIVMLFSTPALAVEPAIVADSGPEASVPMFDALKVSDTDKVEEIPQGEEAVKAPDTPADAVDGATLLSEDSNIVVTVPAVLPVSVLSDGTVQVATDAKITNGGSLPITVTGITVEPIAPWELASGNTNIYACPVNSKVMRFTIDGCRLPENGIATVGAVPIGDGWVIQGGGEYFLHYGVEIPAMESEFSTELAKVTYTVDGPPSRTLTYMDRGEVYTTTTVPQGTEVVIQNCTVNRDDYLFMGWNVDQNATEAEWVQGAIMKLNTDTTLYAVWKEAATLTYDGNGASGTAPEATKVLRGTNVAVKNGSDLTKSGYTFLGWSENPDATMADIGPGDEIEVSYNMTLYAVWGRTEAAYIVQWLDEEGNRLKDDEVRASFVGDIVSARDVDKSIGGGYDFDADNPANVVSAEVTAASGTVLKLYFKRLEYTITYMDRGTKCAFAHVLSGSTCTIIDCPNTRGSYIFIGWDDNAASTHVVFASGDVMIPETNITLYAVWKEAATLTYDGNGATNSAPTGAKVLKGSQVTIVGAGSMTMPGYAFKGWSESSSATTATYTPGTKLTLNKNTTLYAVWAKQATLTYDGNGASGTIPAAVTGDSGTVVTLPDKGSMTKANCAFRGWSEVQTAVVASHAPGSKYTLTNNVTLFAVWEDLSQIPEANIDWEYTLNDTTSTITLTKYIGESTDVTVHNKYRIGEKVYQNVVMGTSTQASGPFTGSPKKAELTSVVFEKGVALPDDSSHLFGMGEMMDGYDALTTIDVSQLDTSNVANMSEMFDGCFSLTSLNVSHFNTSNVTDMNSMFGGCFNLTSLDVSNFNTSSVTNMRFMFSNCFELTSLDVSSFNTSNVTDMSYMFQGCSGLTRLDVSHFNTSNATNMCYMFGRCPGLTSLDVGNFNTSNVTDMSCMFSDCSKLTNLDVSHFNTSNVTNMWAMFSGCSSLTSLNASNFDTSNVTDMSSMFAGCSSLTTIYASDAFITDKVTNSSNMFTNCSKLVGGNGTKYSASHVDKTYACVDRDGQPGYFTCLADYAVLYSDGTLAFQKGNTAKGDHGTIVNSWAGENGWLTKTYTNAISVPWNASVSSITKVKFIDKTVPASTAYWFYGCSNLTTVNTVGLDTSKAASMSNMFANCTNLTALDISNFSTNRVMDMNNMFYNCSSLASIDVSKLETSNALYMSNMFYGCSGLTNLDVTNFDISQAMYTSAMFRGCSNLANLDVSNFKTGNVIDMGYMFDGCSALTSLNVSGWDTGKVANMTYMFNGCSNLATLDVSNWDTSKVTNMSYLFNNCRRLAPIDVSGWKTGTVTNMRMTFCNCSVVTELDVSGWDTGAATNMTYMFYGCSNLATIHASNSFVVDKVTSHTGMFSYCPKLVGGNGTSYNTSYQDKTYARIDKPGQPGYFTLKTDAVEASLDWEYTVDDTTNTITLTKYIGESLDVVVHSKYKVGNVLYENVKMGESSWGGPGPFAGSDKRDNLTSVVFEKGVSLADDSSYLFGTGDAMMGCGSLTTLDISQLDTSNVTNMYSMFGGCSSLATLDASNLDTSNVTNMNLMFDSCSSLTALDLSGFNTSNVTDMGSMFSGCSGLTSLNITSFDTSKVTNMNSMFVSCSGLPNLDVSHFDTSKVTSMSYMFYGGSNLTTIYTGDAFTTDKVTDSVNMFTSCSKLVGGNGTKYNSSCQDKTYARIDKAGQPGYFTAVPNAVMDTASFAMEEPGLMEIPVEALTPEPTPTEPKQPEKPIQYELTISGPSVLAVEEGITLEITKTPEDDETITWSSSDETIATVDGTGLVTGVAEGEVTISAQAGETVCEWPMVVEHAIMDVDGQWEYVVDGDVLTLTRYIGDETEIVVASRYKADDQVYDQVILGETVYDEDAEMWTGPFAGAENRADITSITYETGVMLPENTENIYEGCESLTIIIIPGLDDEAKEIVEVLTDGFRLSLFTEDGTEWKKSEDGELEAVEASESSDAE